MPLTILMFVVALCLSTIAAYYSIVGLTAIFAAAVVPIIVMGSILEIAKLTVTVWLHDNWVRCKWLMKSYLSVAVIILMLITSMGIFGFLSKAHMDQSLVSGDVQAKIAIYDEKIRISKENIDANRRALKQMDEAVDQIMGRSTTETGAERSVQIRRQQGPERKRLIAEIEAEQKKISTLNEERAPIAAEVRKVEAEVGPIKYIAALIYDEAQDTSTLERAVRWVIILLVVVFDPLAVMMLLAASESRKWQRQGSTDSTVQLEVVKPTVADTVTKTPLVDIEEPPTFSEWAANNVNSYPGNELEVEELNQAANNNKPKEDFHAVEEVEETPELSEELETSRMKQARILWKQDNPAATLKEQRKLLSRGQIDNLPWELYDGDPRIQSIVDFGKKLPARAFKGDQFVLTDSVPSRLYKFNGSQWIEINKKDTDTYTYNLAYIDFLIAGVSTGQYDPDVLTDSERIQIENRLRQDNK